MSVNTIAPVTQLVAASITTKTSPSGSESAETDREDVTIRYADRKAGPAIDELLSKDATETTPAGTYQATFLDTDLVQFLPEREGRTIYEDVYLGSVLYKSTPLLVIRAP